MSTSGKTPSADNRNRPPRVAPRRKVQPTEQPAEGTYDSNEFPVLLRMPDVSRPILGSESQEAIDTSHDGSTDLAASDGAVDRQPPHTHRIRHKWKDGGSGKSSRGNVREKRFTGKAVARFWSMIPPQVASGGMLLAVIALCIVLLRDSNPKTPATDSKKEWSGGTLNGAGDNVVHVPDDPVPLVPTPKTTERQAERSSVAAKPTFPISEPTPSKREPIDKTEESVGGWPTSPIDEGNKTTPVQGWPDELTEAPEEDGTMLNAPLESARRLTAPTIRTSQRDYRPQSAPSIPQPGMTNAPYLNGTVEIPPPSKMYRQ